MSDSLLTIRNLRVWYAKSKKSGFAGLRNLPHKPESTEQFSKNVLSNVSLELAKHEIVGLIGLNGAGKTTLIKTICGLLDTFQVESVSWQGKPLKFRNPEFKKERYAVFAEDHSFQFFTFREYASYVSASYGRKLSDIDELVHGFHFEAYTDVLLKELSTGNLKKAYLITAFALRPELLILDEPVNGLDFQSTEYLYRLIGGYRQYGTIFFSSHILESICLTSDRVMVLEQGAIKKHFTGQEIEADRIREVLNE